MAVSFGNRFVFPSSVCILKITGSKLSKTSDKCLNFSSAPKTAKKKKDILDDLLDAEMPEWLSFSNTFQKQAYNSFTTSTNKEIMIMIHLMINIVQFCRQY